MKLHNIIVAILLVSVTILASTTYVSDLGASYNKTYDLGAYNNTQTNFDSINTNVNNIRGNITDFNLDLNPLNFVDNVYRFYQIGWGAIKTMFLTYATAISMGSDTFNALGDSGVPIPVWLIPFLTSLLLTSLLAIVAYGLFKWKFEDR